jgi:hypothetical protein
MAEAASSHHPPAPTRRSLTGPLLLWLLIQLSALLLAAGRIPLAAQYPAPAEMLAAQVMAVVQVTAAAVLMPYLMRDAASSVVVVATAWPFAVLAGVLSALAAPTVALAGASVTVWLLALSLSNLAVPPDARHWCATLATVASAGPLVLTYLNAEFGSATSGWLGLLPSVAVLRQVEGNGSQWAAFAVPAAVATAAAVRLILRHRRGQVIHRP